jgi:hypothetical protein
LYWRHIKARTEPPLRPPDFERPAAFRLLIAQGLTLSFTVGLN